MSFRVPKNINQNDTGNISDININFASVETELSALTQDGNLNTSAWITNEHFANSTIKTAKLSEVLTTNLTTSTTALVTGAAIEAYIDTLV
jgi:hypothetical protein